MNDFDRFKMALSQIVGKRLTWKQAIGMQDSAQLGELRRSARASGAGNGKAASRPW